jgi:hypothetical protein
LERYSGCAGQVNLFLDLREAEEACKQLWDDVDVLLQKAEDKTE